MGHRYGVWLGALLTVGSVWGCNPFEFKKCRDLMSASQQVLIDMDDQKADDVAQSLSSVQATIQVCEGVAGDADVAKLRDAQAKLEKQLAGLRARGTQKERPPQSPEELAQLVKEGDRGCPRGQTYEHRQNKLVIRCTGPQLVEMSWSDAVEQFHERRGFAQKADGATLKFESGAEVVTFQFKSPQSAAPASCISVVGAPGIAWQELVARATGVQPRMMKLGRPLLTRWGTIAVLVEGTAEQFVVKLGGCAPTPGQKPYSEPQQ